MTFTWFILIVLCGLANLVFSLAILRELTAGGVKVGYFEIRWHIHRHFKAYKEITREKYGRIGIPYYGYLGSLFLLILFVGLFFLSLRIPG